MDVNTPTTPDQPDPSDTGGSLGSRLLGAATRRPRSRHRRDLIGLGHHRVRPSLAGAAFLALPSFWLIAAPSR